MRGSNTYAVLALNNISTGKKCARSCHALNRRLLNRTLASLMKKTNQRITFELQEQLNDRKIQLEVKVKCVGIKGQREGDGAI